MVNKYSERENDGEAMMPHWRINMIDFHNSHNKYLILGHKDYFLVRINIKCETLMSRSAHICWKPQIMMHIFIKFYYNVNSS